MLCVTLEGSKELNVVSFFLLEKAPDPEDAFKGHEEEKPFFSLRFPFLHLPLLLNF